MAIYIFRGVSKTAKMDLASSCEVLMEQLGSYWTHFREISYFSILKKSMDKTEVPLKSEKKTYAHLYILLNS
jgi:hypothetical protein